MAARVDPVTFEVIRNGLATIADEMATAIERAAYSTVIREMLDYSTALFDRTGRIIAQGTRIPSHMNSMSPALEAILGRYVPLDRWRPGDVIINNDPYRGGQHLPDIETFAPVYRDGQVVAIAGSLGHHLDVGGRAAGSYGGDVWEIYQEGLRLPPVKLVEGGVPNQALLEVIRANIREPDKTLGDLACQVAALHIAARGINRLIDKYGLDTFLAAIDQLIAYCEERMRAKIRQIPEGTYEHEVMIDDDGLSDEPIRIRVRVTIAGGSVIADYTGSSRQSRGPINATLPSTRSATYYVFLALLDPTIPPTYGCYVPISIVAPEGTVVNARPPAPVVGRMTIYHRIVEAILGALAPAIPDKVPAGYYAMSNVYSIGGSDLDQGTSWVFFECQPGGWGGRPIADGLDGYSAHVHNIQNTPVEMAELDYPVRVERYEFIQDSGGAGKFRGGMGVRRDMRVLVDGARVTLQSDRFKFPAQGLFGGRPGRVGRASINPGTADEVVLPSKVTGYPLREGDVFRFESQGGGGYGPPGQRDRRLTDRDRREEKISPKAAREEYGAVPEAVLLDRSG